MTESIYSKTRFCLAEGPLWDGDRWIWLDILDGRLFCDVASTSKLFGFDQMASKIVCTDRDSYLVALADRIVELDLRRQVVHNVCVLGHGPQFRCNDGSVGPDGRFWFGTMEKVPSGLNGRIYSLGCGGDLQEQDASIGIPNTFLWLDEETILISDSFLGHTYRVRLSEDGMLDWQARELWLDLSGGDETPDGGALDSDGNVWLAIWGGARVQRHAPSGRLIDRVELAALQPTSCAFGGAGMDEMLITTAYEGMGKKQMAEFPESGKVAVRKISVSGNRLPSFLFR